MAPFNMESSDDDVPLVKRPVNGEKSPQATTNSDHSPMKFPTPIKKEIEPAISIRNGPIDGVDIDKPATNGAENVNGKRKARVSIARSMSYKEVSGSEDEDEPLSKRRRTSAVNVKPAVNSDSELSEVPLAKTAKTPPKATGAQMGDSSDSDIPLGKKLVGQKVKIEKRAEKEAKYIRSEEKKAAKPKKLKKEESTDEGLPSARKRQIKKSTDKATSTPKKSPKAPSQSAVVSKKGKVKAITKDQEDEDAEIEADEEEYRWWENSNGGDGTVKWNTLEHNGVVFPPEYEPLPKNIKMKYEGVPVKLPPESEEVAVFYGSMLHSTVNVENPTFNKNFFEDFKEILEKTGHAKDKDGNKVKIIKFEKCDFTPIFEHFEADRARKKAISGAEKKDLKAKKDAAESPYMYCLWDGRKQKVGNFRVEPPGLFRGRGEHPKTGRVKKRVLPEQITINIGKGATVPAPPEGHRWKEVKHDQEGTWLAMWQENINGAYKYVMLAANSDIKGQSDYKKFEKARELKKHIDRIRKDYKRDLKSDLMADRQRATAVYLIDQLALRAGNEKGEDEADTVGCCSLKFEHITLKPPNTVIFDFLGKDSIRYYEETEVDHQVFKNLKLFKKPPKGEGDEIFDRLTTSSLNKHLGSYMTGLTAKVFRTYNASWTMSNLLKDMKSTGTIPEKVKDYNDANRKVAIICNHKRTVAASHEATMEKLQDKINGLRYQQWRTKQMMIDVDPKAKKQKGAAYFNLPEDITEDWIVEHQAALVAEQRQKIEKKFQKDNEKRIADGEKEMKANEIKERLAVATELEQRYKKENKTKKVEADGKGVTIEKLEGKIDNYTQRIETMKVQAEDKDNNKEVALGTSKINYIDPRLTVVFSKKFNVPIERFFSKTLREKFDWAVKSVDEDWEF